MKTLIFWLFTSLRVAFSASFLSFLAWLGRFFLSIFSSIRLFFAGLLFFGLEGLFRFALVFFGVGLVTYTGTDYVLNHAIDYLLTRFNAIPVELFDILVFMGVQDFINIVTAALTANIALKSSVSSARVALSPNQGVWNAPRN